MPLNIQDSDEQKTPRPARSDLPAVPPADEAPRRNRNLLIWIFILVAAASAVFLLIQFGVIPVGGAPGDGIPSSADTTAPAARTAAPVEPDTAAGQAGAPPSGLRDRLTGIGGEYTIFISAFHEADDAGELAGRWERAGYPAFVQHSSGWYRVALGRYPTFSAAREEAEKLRQALEEGYWIGRAAL